MTSAVRMLIGGAVVNALAFSGSNYLFSHMGNNAEAERDRHGKKLLKRCKNPKQNGVKKDSTL